MSEKESSRSLIKRRKRMGPMQEPCMMPDLTGRGSDTAPDTDTFWDLPDRYEPIHDSRGPVMP